MFHKTNQKLQAFVERLPNSGFLKNSFWVILGSFFSKGINFISIALIAKQLGPELFGEYNVIQTTVGMFGTVSGLGMGMAATKLIAEWREKDIDKAGRITGTLYHLSFMVSLVVAIAFFISSEWLSESLLSNGNLSLLLKITSLIVIFDSINGVQSGVLAGFESFREITYIGIFSGIIGSPLLVIGAFTGGLTGLTTMLLLSRIINVLANRYYLRKRFRKSNIRVRPMLHKDVIRSIFGISIPSFMSSFATSPVNWITTSIFVNQPMGYTHLGSYNAANQLRTIVLFLPDSAGRVTIPQLANAFGNDDLKKFRSTVKLTLLWNFVLSVLPALVLLFFGNLFMNFFGAKYDLNTNLLLIVLATGIMVAITNAVGYIFICSNLIWYDFVLRVLWGLALILLIYFYGRYNGAIGYGISYLGAFIFNLFCQIILLLIKFRKVFL